MTKHEFEEFKLCIARLFDAKKFDSLFLELGNGSEIYTGMLLLSLALQLFFLRKEQPTFANDVHQAYEVIHNSFLEFEHTVKCGSEKEQMDAALKLCANCIRFLCDEFKPVEERDIDVRE